MRWTRSSDRLPPAYRVLGHTTLAELPKVSQDWAEAHEFTLFMLATVLVGMVGGVDTVLINPCSVVFGQQHARGVNAHLDVVGVLPVTLVIADAGPGFPLHRPRPRLPSNQRTETETTLVSVVSMCPGAINAGTFFRIPKDTDHQAVPAIGSLQAAQAGKDWR